MIKPVSLLIAITIIAASCNNNNNSTTDKPVKVAEEEEKFFPVTSYIKGQIFDIKQKGVTPLLYITSGNKTDSVMIKLDELENYTKEFLQPVIDSTNLIKWYTESKFLDQTINAYTFTYDLSSPQNDSLKLMHWDVYVDPETGKVKRLYMLKKTGNGKTLQLTWLNNEWFKIITIANNPDGSTSVEKEEKISWNY